MAIECDTREVSGVTILNLRGRLVMGQEIRLGARSELMLREIICELTKKGQKRVLLNLASVSYVDSSGVGQLVSALASAHSQKAELKLLNPTGEVRQVLRMMKLDAVFDVMTDETTAVKSFSVAAAANCN